MHLLNGHYVARRQVSVSFLLLLLDLITVACIYVEISLGSCLQKNGCMGQRSTKNHNVQLFIRLSNQYPTIQWPLLDASTGTHGVFITLSLSKYCLLRLCRNSMGSCWRKDILRVKGLPQTTKSNFFVLVSAAVEILCENIVAIKFPSQYGNSPLEHCWVCTEHEVEVATSTRKHWLVYDIYQSFKVK